MRRALDGRGTESSQRFSLSAEYLVHLGQLSAQLPTWKGNYPPEPLIISFSSYIYFSTVFLIMAVNKVMVENVFCLSCELLVH